MQCEEFEDRLNAVLDARGESRFGSHDRPRGENGELGDEVREGRQHVDLAEGGVVLLRDFRHRAREIGESEERVPPFEAVRVPGERDGIARSSEKGCDRDGRPDGDAAFLRIPVEELHVEAGHKLNGSLVREGLVDEYLVYVAPTLLGIGRELAAFGPLERLADARRLQFTDVARIGDDLRILARPLPG